MFLTKEDLSPSLYPEIRTLLARSSDAIILQHCATAEQTIESYLSRRYHIRPELDKIGANRNDLLLQIARDLAIYYLYQLAETIPAIRVKNYDNAMEILRDYANGTINLPGVPAAPEPEEGTPDSQGVSYGSRPPRAPLFK